MTIDSCWSTFRQSSVLFWIISWLWTTSLNLTIRLSLLFTVVDFASFILSLALKHWCTCSVDFLFPMSQLLMSVFEKAMKSHNVLENDPYDWEKYDSEDLLTITAAANTAQQLTRLTPAYLGYWKLKTYHFWHSCLCFFFILIVALSVMLFSFPSHSVGSIMQFSCCFYFRPKKKTAPSEIPEKLLL